MFRFDPSITAPSIRRALQLLAGDLSIEPAGSAVEANLVLSLGADGCAVRQEAGKTLVAGKTLPQLLRALARLRGWRLAGQSIPRRWMQTSYFDCLGLMLDVSRNGVPRPRTVQGILHRMALMGLDTLLLYMEDTYEVPGQPHIGYLRGRYAQEELRQIDDYAAHLGIAVIPCIQSLAHLEQMLRWPVFAAVRDTPDILLVDEPKTYALLEQMIEAAAVPFRSRRIHLGMDEAHNLGTGRYRQLHGCKPGFQLMRSHLRKVMAITRRLGLQPMIWGDMYFRLGSRTGDYYDPKSKVPPAVARQIPRDLQLVLWDYYHADPVDYLRLIKRHRALGKEPVFAGGLWTWTSFWQNFTKARATTDAGMTACKTAGVREAFTTIWCDDGAEVDLWSMLPGLQYFAEHGYQLNVGDAAQRCGFLGSTGEELVAWTMPARLDMPPGMASSWEVGENISPHPSSPAVAKLQRSRRINLAIANPSKYLLWQDALLGILDAHLSSLPLGAHYAKLEQQLTRLIRDTPTMRHRLEFPRRLAAVLKDKAELGVKLRVAYRRGDRTRLRHLADVTVPRLLRNVRRLCASHRAMWMEMHKPHGWEVLECRYATLEARVTWAGRRVRAYLDGRIAGVEELDEPRLKVMDWPDRRLALMPWPARRLMTPSTSC